MAYFYVEIEDGAPISFQVNADFRGPIVKFHNPVIDFGLIKVNTTESTSITVENTSPIQAELLFKKSVNGRLTFENMMALEDAKTI